MSKIFIYSRQTINDHISHTSITCCWCYKYGYSIIIIKRMFNHMCSFCLTNSQHSKYYDQNKTFNSIIFNISVNYIIIHLASISLYLGCFVGYF